MIYLLYDYSMITSLLLRRCEAGFVFNVLKSHLHSVFSRFVLNVGIVRTSLQ